MVKKTSNKNKKPSRSSEAVLSISNGMKSPIYNIKGVETGTIDLPEALFGLKRNDALLRQVVLAMEANKRTPIANTKGRGEVRGGGKKPWKQKGTGRARHGSIRSPIWRGGGTTHGPVSEKDYSQKINKKMKDKALAIVLSQKLKDGKILFVDSIAMNAPKTTEAKSALLGIAKAKGFAEIGTRRNNAAIFLMAKRSEAVSKSFRNMGNVLIEETRNVNPVDVMKYRYVVVVEPEASVKVLSSRIEK